VRKYIPECKVGDEMALVSAGVLKHPVGQIRRKREVRENMFWKRWKSASYQNHIFQVVLL